MALGMVALPICVATAQVVDKRIVSETPSAVTVEFTINWGTTLSQDRDSLSTFLSGGTLALALGRAAGVLSHTLPVGSRAGSSVRVLTSEYDEIDLTAPQGDSLLVALDRPAVALDGWGYHRKKLVVTAQVRTIVFDAASNSLRRFRRVVLRVDRTQPLSKVTQTFASNPHLLVTESVLATGSNYKLAVPEGGVYKVDRQLLVELGLDPGGIDPAQVRVFGNGGEALPAVNADPRIADLAELGVVVVGGGDGSFGAQDAVYFYTSGPLTWRYDDTRGEWVHRVNPFETNAYVFLKIAGGTNNNLALPDLVGTPDITVSSATGRHVLDIDEFIWSKEHGSGHTWVSNPIRIGGRLDVFTNEQLPGALPGTLSYRARLAVKSNPAAFFTFSSGGEALSRARAAFAVSSSSDQPTAAPTEVTFTQEGGTAPLDLRLTVDSGQNNDPQAALDWIRVSYDRRNEAVDGVLQWHSGEQPGLIRHVLTGFVSEPIVFDVTDMQNISRLPVGQSGGNYFTQVQVQAGAPRELVAFQPDAAATLDAETATVVPNQNLHGIDSFPDFVIVTPQLLAGPANDLASHRRSEGLDVAVIDVEQIYNEFAGGQRDMRAVRDYLKFLYDRAPDDESTLRYVLLMGDGHFDFRNLRVGIEQSENLILPYETEETFNPDASYSSDDYFGLLDDNEGLWNYRGYSVSSSERLDVGIGRFPVATPEEATMLVEKVKRYEDPATFGTWRTRYTYVADDAFTGANGGQAEGDLHLYNMDSVAEYVKQNVFAGVNPRKIYAESFDRVFVSEFKVPGAKERLLESLEEGSLVFNYSGHGGPRGLAQEDLLTFEDAATLTNGDRLPVFITATCSFGWWDIDDSDSGAEALLLNPNGGAVAMFTTVRLVYTSPSPSDLNPGLNRALNIALFRRDSEGRFARFGDAMVETKNTSVGILGNSRKFNLLGDPTMRIGLPQRDIRINTLNGVDLAAETGQARALDRVTIEGSVLRPDGTVDAQYDGPISLTVFDAERRVPIKEWRWMPNPYYSVREDLLWRGNVAATNGSFAATFVVPKDISYSNGAGRVSAYGASGSSSAVGYTERFLVGGTTDNPPDDAAGPEISLFLNDTTFVSGGLTQTRPELIVKLYDESGINTVGAGVGHEMLMVINGDESSAVNIAGSFESNEGSFQEGQVRYTLPELATGPGFLSVRAWDVLNNSGSATLEYFVAGTEALSIRNVYNYPNPMSARTRFILEHNQLSGTLAELEIRIYTLNGRLVRTIPTEDALPSGFLNAGPIRVVWDGRDDDYDRLASGIYLYKVRLQTEATDGAREVAESIEKLALIR